MITCPNCEHQNPEEALQCENCYSSLPGSNNCPNCGASVQTDATFCGQCGFNLQTVNLVPETEIGETVAMSELNRESEPEPMPTAMSPMASPWDDEDFTAADEGAESVSRTELMGTTPESSMSQEVELESDMESDFDNTQELSDTEEVEFTPYDSGTRVDTPWDFIEAPNERFESQSGKRSPVEIEPEPVSSTEEPIASPQSESVEPKESVAAPASEPVSSPEESVAAPETAESVITFSESQVSEPTPSATSAEFDSATRLQSQNVSLLHVQSNTVLRIPDELDLVHIGKPNNKIPPDIDVSGFANAEIVSRIHADLRVEGDIYFLEDVGSSNGTYINHVPLIPGNRHRLRAGDRIALGKEDLVTFIFQID